MSTRPKIKPGNLDVIRAELDRVGRDGDASCKRRQVRANAVQRLHSGQVAHFAAFATPLRSLIIPEYAAAHGRAHVEVGRLLAPSKQGELKRFQSGSVQHVLPEQKLRTSQQKFPKQK